MLLLRRVNTKFNGPIRIPSSLCNPTKNQQTLCHTNSMFFCSSTHFCKTSKNLSSRSAAAHQCTVLLCASLGAAEQCLQVKFCVLVDFEILISCCCQLSRSFRFGRCVGRRRSYADADLVRLYRILWISRAFCRCKDRKKLWQSVNAKFT